MIGLATFTEDYRRLLAAFNRQFREDMAAEYHRAIGQRCDFAEWRTVVDTALHECDTFPPIKTLLGILYHQRRQSSAPPSDDPDGGETCPFCHAGRVVLGLTTGRELIEWDHAATCRLAPKTLPIAWKEYPTGNPAQPWRREVA